MSKQRSRKCEDDALRHALAKLAKPVLTDRVKEG